MERGTGMVWFGTVWFGMGGVGGGVGKCVGVWGEARKMCGEVWGGVWESVWGEWGSVLACGKRMWGEKWGRCSEVYLGGRGMRGGVGKCVGEVMGDVGKVKGMT